MFKCGYVAIEAEARDDADTGFRCHGVMADGLTFVNIADVHLDHGQVAACQCVAQAEAGVRKCTRIDNQAKDFGVR